MCSLLIVPAVIIHLRALLVERFGVPPPGAVEKALATGVMLYGILTCFGENRDFVYFQF